MEKVEKLKRMEAKRIPENIDYQAINGLATEAKQNYKNQPETIAQASRISGVNPLTLAFDGLHRTRKNRESARIIKFEAVASSRMIDCEEALLCLISLLFF